MDSYNPHQHGGIFSRSSKVLSNNNSKKRCVSSSCSESNRCAPSLLYFLFLASRRAHIEPTPVRTDATDALILFPTRIFFRKSATGPRTFFSFTGRKQLTTLSGGRFPHTTHIYIHSAQSTHTAVDVSCIARFTRSSQSTTCKPAVPAAAFTLILWLAPSSHDTFNLPTPT